MAARPFAVAPAPTFALRGFTLVEMAVVFFVLALLLGSALVPLAAQREQRDLAATDRLLGEASEVLIGHAARRPARPHLPCPDTDGDGVENRANDGACANPAGDLPWADLGVGRRDAWERPLGYVVAPAFSHADGFALLTPGTVRVCADAACTLVVATHLPAAVFSRGRNGAIEQLPEATPPTLFERIPSAETDDRIVWLPAAILVQRMLAAGKLP